MWTLKKWSSWGAGRRKGVPGRRNSRNNSREAENSMVCTDTSLGGIRRGRNKEERLGKSRAWKTLCATRGA